MYELSIINGYHNVYGLSIIKSKIIKILNSIRKVHNHMAKSNNKTHQKRMDKNCHIPDGYHFWTWCKSYGVWKNGRTSFHLLYVFIVCSLNKYKVPFYNIIVMKFLCRVLWTYWSGLWIQWLSFVHVVHKSFSFLVIL